MSLRILLHASVFLNIQNVYCTLKIYKKNYFYFVFFNLIGGLRCLCLSHADSKHRTSTEHPQTSQPPCMFFSHLIT